jgi:hypothetical protein
MQIVKSVSHASIALSYHERITNLACGASARVSVRFK